MLLKACRRCGKLIPYGRAYCTGCTPVVRAERADRMEGARKAANKKYNKGRDPKYTQFYRGVQWRRLARARVQADGYKCAKCGAIATEVDHIVPIQTAAGWDLRYDWGNLQSLCVKCHNEKHKRFKKKQRNKYNNTRELPDRE